jgi:hypothetical protein
MMPMPTTGAHGRIPRAAPSSTKAACISALVLIAVIVAAWIAAASSARTPVPYGRDALSSQPLVAPGPVSVPLAARERNRRLLP